MSDPRASSDNSAVKVPFELFGNNILIKIRINDSRPIWFVFDSGANVNVINERAAKKLGLAIKGSSTLDANGATATGSLVEIQPSICQTSKPLINRSKPFRLMFFQSIWVVTCRE